jgi:hypothetical protein
MGKKMIRLLLNLSLIVAMLLPLMKQDEQHNGVQSEILFPVITLQDGDQLQYSLSIEVSRDSIYHTYSFQGNHIPENVTFHTNLPPLTIYPDADYEDLPYDIYEKSETFRLNTVGNLSSDYIQSYHPDNRLYSGPSERELRKLLDSYNIPILPDYHAVTQSINQLSDDQKMTLKSKHLISPHETPLWLVQPRGQLTTSLNSENEVTFSAPLFYGAYYSMGIELLKSFNCITDEDESALKRIKQQRGGFIPYTYFNLPLNQFINLEKLIIRSGQNEIAASCIEGEREIDERSITIDNPTLPDAGSKTILFFRS